MKNDKGMIVLTSLVAVGIFVIAGITSYFHSMLALPIAIIGLIFIPFILLQNKVRYSNISVKLEHIMFFITLAVIIIGFILIYTPV
ncbi:MAG: hypothetical protein MJ232_02225 [archaeon]|nr:hypothetical protein [archaeon]